MILAIRYADTQTAQAYPLDCHGQLSWRVDENTHGCEPVRNACIKLPEIPAGAILVPSLALLNNDDYRFQFTLKLGERRWVLQAVPGESAPERAQDPAVSTHIDCFHVHAALRDAELEVELRAPIRSQKDGLQQAIEYILTVTCRELEITAIGAPGTAVHCPAPPAISQMSIGKKLGPRICSPTCTAMVLARYGRKPDLARLSETCFDPVSNLYGIWPMALRAASRMGSLGAVEVFDDWDSPQRVIAAGLPVIASIRFAAGELPGSPLKATHGHLVVIYSIGPDDVLVCDPSAANAAAVPRTYAASDFGRAWLQHRGAAYILLP